MKNYEKPNLDVIELCQDESLASGGSGNSGTIIPVGPGNPGYDPGRG